MEVHLRSVPCYLHSHKFLDEINWNQFGKFLKQIKKTPFSLQIQSQNSNTENRCTKLKISKVESSEQNHTTNGPELTIQIVNTELELCGIKRWTR
jgi:hypothetical protein